MMPPLFRTKKKSRPSKQCEFCNYLLVKCFISQGCQSDLIGQNGPGSPDGSGGPGGPGGPGGKSCQDGPGGPGGLGGPGG